MLARSEIDKDMTVLLGFQVYKSENNKVKLNKSRLPRLIWLQVQQVRHDCDMILAKLTFIAWAWQLGWAGFFVPHYTVDTVMTEFYTVSKLVSFFNLPF